MSQVKVTVTHITFVVTQPFSHDALQTGHGHTSVSNDSVLDTYVMSHSQLQQRQFKLWLVACKSHTYTSFHRKLCLCIHMFQVCKGVVRDAGTLNYGHFCNSPAFGGLCRVYIES